ncbi:hypothetical protein [Flavobacterium sp.]|uniref:hypothetical protein n=1 Tax=Flavobacterium sp. TaxID=239 RepID=UPI0031D77006
MENFKPKSKNHTLSKMWNDEYGLEFQEVIKSFTVLLNSNKKIEKFKNKLFLKQSDITIDQQNQYIQSAVECTVVKYFIENFPERFSYEPNLIVGNKTDVECQFSIKNLTFNIEVKATSYLNHDMNSNDTINLRSVGRMQNYNEFHNLLRNLMPNLESEKRYDNNLKSHLISTQSKLPKVDNRKFCNVLIVGCNDSDDIQNHFHYLYAQNGFFTQNPIIEHSNFDLVDIVFLSNLFFKHNFNTDNHKLNKESWQFEKSFIVGFRNPYRKDQKLEHLDLIETIIPNYNKSFKDYKNAPEFIRLKHFIHTELGMNRKIYHF